MCFKVKAPAQDTTPAVPAPAPSQATPEAAGVLVKGASSGGSTVSATSGDDMSQRRRRRSASQGLGL